MATAHTGAQDPDKIALNTADVRLLTQLPGISKTIAYRIVNHRQRHGYLTAWEELQEIKEFPVERLDEIKLRAALVCPEEESCVPPRHLDGHHLENVRKKPAGFTRKLRATHRAKKAHDPASHRPH